MIDPDLASRLREAERQRLEQEANRKPLNLRNMLVGGGAIGALTGGPIGYLVGGTRGGQLGLAAGTTAGVLGGLGIEQKVGRSIARARELLAAKSDELEEEINRKAMDKYVQHVHGITEPSAAKV